MRRKLQYGFVVLLLVCGSSANAYFLQRAYIQYQSILTVPSTVSSSTTSKIANAKQKTINSGTQGELAAQGQYTFVESDHSKIENGDATAQLVLASDEALGVNYVLADTTGGALSSDKLTSDWTLQTINTDPMWAPQGCSSKPTYFLQKHIIVINDGKTLSTDKYNSYVVFDLLTQKFRYFGGDNFTNQQATKEKILSVVDENDKLIFYIDPADSQGQFADDSSFKHSRAAAPGYIIRRVIDVATMHYTDYHLKFALPQDPAFDTYGINVGTTADELINITSDASDKIYAGAVNNNAITLAAQSLTALPSAQVSQPADPAADKLDAILAEALPAFLPTGSGANMGQSSHLFYVTKLGARGSTQYLIANSSQSGYSTPVIYDTTTSTATPMTTQAIFTFGSYVPLGVF